MVFEAKEIKQFTGFSSWYVYVNGKKALGPFVSEQMAETKIKACLQNWFHTAKRKGA